MEVDINEDVRKNKIENFNDKNDTDEIISNKENALVASDNIDSSKNLNQWALSKTGCRTILFWAKFL